jgi:hypothetical protein
MDDFLVITCSGESVFVENPLAQKQSTVNTPPVSLRINLPIMYPPDLVTMLRAPLPEVKTDWAEGLHRAEAEWYTGFRIHCGCIMTDRDRRRPHDFCPKKTWWSSTDGALALRG